MLALQYSKKTSLCKGYRNYRAKLLREAFTKIPAPSSSRTSYPHHTGLSHTVVCGMGGSSLGSRASAEALGIKKIFFLDNVDPEYIAEKLAEIPFEKSLFILISKSGETIEVLSLTEILLARATEKKLNIQKHFLIITDNTKSSLGEIAKKKHIPIILSPKAIPGRFSVLSSVGLIPLAHAGANIQDLSLAAIKNSPAIHKTAYQLASFLYEHYGHGRRAGQDNREAGSESKKICVLFPYGEKLSTFCDWAIQLIAESIGKTRTIGITPIKAIGAKDQHSQLQLFLDGPDDKTFIFFKIQKTTSTLKIPGKSYSLKQLLDAEYAGVLETFKKLKKPFVEIVVPVVDEKNLGELFFLFELVVAFLGMLFGVNPFDQPAVEQTKKITKAILK